MHALIAIIRTLIATRRTLLASMRTLTTLHAEAGRAAPLQRAGAAVAWLALEAFALSAYAASKAQSVLSPCHPRAARGVQRGEGTHIREKGTHIRDKGTHIREKGYA